MGKYYSEGGIRIGRVGKEKYYIERGKNIVQTVNKYVPINSTYLKREEFKEYILSLITELERGWEIKVLDDIPVAITNKTLYFINNGETYDVYVDDNNIRQEISLVGEEEEEEIEVYNLSNYDHLNEAITAVMGEDWILDNNLQKKSVWAEPMLGAYGLPQNLNGYLDIIGRSNLNGNRISVRLMFQPLENNTLYVTNILNGTVSRWKAL